MVVRLARRSDQSDVVSTRFDSRIGSQTKSNMFDSSDHLSDRSNEAFTRYDRRTDQSNRPVGPTIVPCKRPVSANCITSHTSLAACIEVVCWFSSPRAGSGVVRIDPLRFLAGCHKKRLNQALSVLSVSLGFFWCCTVNYGLFLGCVIFMLFMCFVAFCLFLLGCQYQCNWLTEKNRPRNDL